MAGLLSGTLDGLAAIVQYTLKGGKEPGRIFQYIASAVFGKPAFSGGGNMIACGILFHYCITFAFTILFFFGYPYLVRLIKNTLLSGLLYGVFVWAVMNLLVVPATKISAMPFKLSSAITALVILVCMIGLPVSIITAGYYRNKK